MSSSADESSLFEICLQPSKVEDLEMLYQNASGWNEKTNIERLFQKANTIAMNSEALAVLKQRKKNKKNKRARAQARKQPEKLQSDPFSPFSWTQPSPWPMAEDREQYTLAAPSLSDLIRPRPVEFIRLPNLAECAPQEFLRRAFLDEAGYDAGYPPIELENLTNRQRKNLLVGARNMGLFHKTTRLGCMVLGSGRNRLGEKRLEELGVSKGSIMGEEDMDFEKEDDDVEMEDFDVELKEWEELERRE